MIATETDRLTTSFQEIYGRPPSVIASAPGRIEFIGNHTDYNGGPVLGASINRTVTVALAFRSDGRRQFASDHEGTTCLQAFSVGPLQKQTGKRSWINYPLGVIAALPAFNLHAPAGFDFLVHSTLPIGAGLSSSAAIELASTLAFLVATNQPYSPELIARIGRHAENNFVGVPCGILDQGVVAFGQTNHLVFIDCQKPQYHLVPLSEDVHLWVFNTHTKHALVDGFYAERHSECMLAAKMLGVARLADATLEDVEKTFRSVCEPKAQRVQHVIGEIGRVHATVAALQESNLSRVGRLLTSSHRSSQYFFENSTAELDFLVDRLAITPHVYGARLTGGGFGGAVFALTSAEFTAEVAHGIAEAYERQFSAVPDILALKTGEGARVLHPTRPLSSS